MMWTVRRSFRCVGAVALLATILIASSDECICVNIDAQAIFDEVDTDKTGTIDKKEFYVSWMQACACKAMCSPPCDHLGVPINEDNGQQDF